ncbi:MAG TPA: hypothetical protein VMQ73_11950 [Methylomirabilota bacterium]|nr:hypothetical protein [Methylomirabilota bacterium]
MTKFFAALALAVLLAGCSYFSKPSNDSNWTKASGAEDQTASDLSACRQQADAVINRDADIDRDISSARTPSSVDTDTQAFLSGVDNYDREQRFRRITSECMRQRGYVLPEKSPLPLPSP